MPEGKILIIDKMIAKNRCPRFGQPHCSAHVFYSRDLGIAIMLGPEEKEITLQGDKQTVQLLEEILKQPKKYRCQIRRPSSPEQDRFFQEAVEAIRRIPEEPTSTPALLGLVRERLDCIT